MSEVDRSRIRSVLIAGFGRRVAGFSEKSPEEAGEHPIFGHGALDSLAFVELVQELEEQTGGVFAVEDLDFDDLETFDALVDQLHRLQQPSAAAG